MKYTNSYRYRNSMIESILYNVGIHCRLSLDVGSVGEYGSIQTQKMMLEKYCLIITIL